MNPPCTIVCAEACLAVCIQLQAVEQQVQDRIHRLGQCKLIMALVYLLTAASSSASSCAASRVMLQAANQS
jgi:hypothetical protein